jgi:hypothetical protein
MVALGAWKGGLVGWTHDADQILVCINYMPEAGCEHLGDGDV